MREQIIFDCERMKYPYTGLYSFCKELGNALLRQKPSSDNKIAFYVPQKEKGVFGLTQDYLIQNHLHKFFPKKISNYDVWHCTYQGSNYVPFPQRGLKIITTIHDLNFLHLGKTEVKKKKYLQKVQRLIDRSDVVVTISNFVKKQLLENLSVNKDVEVIYNGRNLPPTVELAECDSIKERPFFFTIGTITEKKNFHVLAAMLLDNDYDLIIAGVTQSQAYYSKIIEVAKKLGVEGRIKLIGTITEHEKYRLLKHCAAFCFPSLAEGFGLPVVEAMQLGTPVILSKATSLPEIGGPHAIYFESFETEAIQFTSKQFLNNPFNETKRANLINWAAQFDWNIAARKYWELYQK